MGALYLNVIFSALYLKHFLLHWRLKFIEMTECIYKIVGFTKQLSKYSSEVKKKITKRF